MNRKEWFSTLERYTEAKVEGFYKILSSYEELCPGECGINNTLTTELIDWTEEFIATKEVLR